MTLQEALRNYSSALYITLEDYERTTFMLIGANEKYCYYYHNKERCNFRGELSEITAIYRFNPDVAEGKTDGFWCNHNLNYMETKDFKLYFSKIWEREEGI